MRWWQQSWGNGQSDLKWAGAWGEGRHPCGWGQGEVLLGVEMKQQLRRW